jgi:hypothetical protein
MKVSLVHDRYQKAILAKLERIEMKLSEAVTVMTEIKAHLQEASEEIIAKLDAYAEAIDMDPAAAMALLEDIRARAQGLANIVPGSSTDDDPDPIPVPAAE